MLSSLLQARSQYKTAGAAADLNVHILFSIIYFDKSNARSAKMYPKKFHWSTTKLIISCNWSQALIFHIFFPHFKISDFNLILSFNKKKYEFILLSCAARIASLIRHVAVSILFDIKRDPIGDVELYISVCVNDADEGERKKKNQNIISSAADVVVTRRCKRKRDQEFIYAGKRDCSLSSASPSQSLFVHGHSSET